ncbi:MAG: (deoxy)nucleoside triphosphate pyrophosphohydrolase [Oscillospiraceae bacterium]|nr:(deoxy)nucleoside triphosphate pyrophosphohydrolase [Oscillospiraceae bacterium]
MKNVKVAAAVICDSLENRRRILSTARGYGEYKGRWEFPGGKIEAGESPEKALVREIKEELCVDIKAGELIDVIEYDYPDFHLTMYCYWCEVVNDEIVLNEAEAARWLTAGEMYDVDWLPADKVIIDKILSGMLEES